MNTEHNHIELFDCYLKNQLNDFDKKQFEEKLLSDKEFKAQFNNYFLLVESIKQQKRDELKQYFKKNVKMEYWGQNFWGKKWTIAASIGFLIFGSLYFVTSQLSKNISNKEIVNTEIQEQEPLIESPNEKAETSINKKTEVKDKNEIIVPQVVENNSQFLDIEFNSENDLDSDKSPVPGAVDNGFKEEIVAKETLVKTLKVNIIEKTIDIETEKTNTSAAKVQSKSTSSESKKDINLNQSGNKPLDEENDATLKKEIKTNKIQIELWSHPLNFVGYTYENSVLKLYGYTTENISVFKLNDKNYIKIDNNFYSFSNCKNCKLTIETNQDILNLLK